MDLLFVRYASPFSFMGNMMRVGRFSEFVDNIIEVVNKETEDKGEARMWELYLHRVFDKSYSEFTEAQKVEQDNRKMTTSEIETTIAMSNSILANFNPEERG